MIAVGALLIGTAVGILTGMFGVGGGFLITPLLNVALQVAMPIAIGTGCVDILGVSTAGLYRRRHEGATDYKMAVVVFGGNYVGVRLGAATLTWLGNLGSLVIRGNTLPAVDFIVLCIYFVLLGSIAGYVLYDASRKEAVTSQVGLFSKIKLPPYTRFESLENPVMSIPVIAYFGVFIGFLTGLLGIGGGVIMLPALIYLVGMKLRCASATSLALIWLSTFASTITHASLGNVDISLAVPLLIGGSLGLQLGVNICHKLGDKDIKRYFSFVVWLAMFIVVYKILVMISVF